MASGNEGTTARWHDGTTARWHDCTKGRRREGDKTTPAAWFDIETTIEAIGHIRTEARNTKERGHDGGAAHPNICRTNATEGREVQGTERKGWGLSSIFYNCVNLSLKILQVSQQ